MISGLTKAFLKESYSSKKKKIFGFFTVVIVITVSVTITALILLLGYTINTYLGIIIEAVMTYQCLATKSLYTESMKVYYALDNGIEAGRQAVSMIVGRDTESLDEAGVTKACVETVAENTSDGIIAPMIYLAVGGPVLGMCYKAINTMDSMIGYKSDKYIDYGRYAAKLDDFVNFIPSRISAGLMIISCIFLGNDYSIGNAYRIYVRDRFNHASPNSAQTESVCAGALSIQLAGPASYFGKLVEKKYIGDSVREICREDIKRANRLMFATAILCEVLSCMVVIFIGIVYTLIFQ